MGTYSTRRGRPLGVSEQGAAGVLTNNNLFALDGESEMVTTFDDFNYFVLSEDHATADTTWETLGWELVDRNTATDPYIECNDPAKEGDFYSCINTYAGSKADAGGLAQLTGASNTLPASGGAVFPHIWIPHSGMDAEVLDKTTITFACRVGIVSNNAACDGKFFIGFAQLGDAAIVADATGIITIASTGTLLGFHFNADSQDTLRLISHRTAATAMAEGVNFTELTDGVDENYTIGHPRWFDLALRCQVTNMSDDDDNGWTIGSWREVGGQAAPGGGAFNQPSEGYAPYVLSDPLDNQTPNDGTLLVPTIEVLNGPTYLTHVKLDWWSMGISRYSHKSPRV
jgi:hypothetical protein